MIVSTGFSTNLMVNSLSCKYEVRGKELRSVMYVRHSVSFGHIRSFKLGRGVLVMCMSCVGIMCWYC